MRLDLTGRHLDITDGIRRTVETKLSKLDRRMNDSALSAQVVLSPEGQGRRADVTLHARGEKFLHASGRGPSVSAALTQVVEKLRQQAETVKGKWNERKRRLGRSPVPPGELAEAPEPKSPASPKRVRVRAPRILRATRQVVSAMSVSEASTLVANGAPLVIFRDVESDRIAVVYRAPGDDLVLVETKG